MPDRTLVRAIVAGVIAAAIGIFLGFEIHWFPVQASTQAHKIDTLYKVLIVATVPIFVLVCTVILYSVWQFRMKPGQELEDGEPIHGNTRLEIAWTVLPALLILGLVSYSFVVLHDIEKKPSAAEMQVNVTGQQFAWSFQYPPSLTGGKAVTSDFLYLPVNEPVRFSMTSKDVIHAFWVPAFRMQEDVVPGITTHYRVTPTRLGTYNGICNELCGPGHATMRTVVHVVTPTEFQAWIRRQATAAPGAAPAPTPANPAAAGASAPAGGRAANSTPAPAGGAAAALGPITNRGAGASAANARLVATGRKVFASNGCGTCHTLADAGSNGQIGPNLGKILTAAKHSAGFIATSIVKPGAYVERGFPAGVMPTNFGSTLSRPQIQALVSYLLKVTGP